MSSDNDEKLAQKREPFWLSVMFNLQLIISFLFALHLIIYEAYLSTTIFALGLTLWAILGITAGAHRLWAHQSYKATTSLRIFLMIGHTFAGHNSIYNWVRLHRLHHKYFQTDFDPFDSRKGFFHSHFICNFIHLSPAQEKLLGEIDMSDLENDKVVMFQKKYFYILYVVVTLLLPMNTPLEYWGEDIWTTIFIVVFFRGFITHNLCMLIHSATTIFDLKDADRKALDNNIVFFLNKSHWLSYHYLSPWDYQTSELGKYGTDCTSKFIRVCAALEFASDLRTADGSLVQDALIKSIEEKKPFSECVTELEKDFSRQKSTQFYITPTKYY